MPDDTAEVRPRTDRMGVTAAGLVFAAWGWLYREQPIEDYGIDAHVEPVHPQEPPRQLLALQIKSGPSFFREASPAGWWFRDSRRHWRYWLGHVLPVIILYDPESEQLFWQHARFDLVQLTAEEGKLLIPRDHVLNRSSSGAQCRQGAALCAVGVRRASQPTSAARQRGESYDPARERCRQHAVASR